MAWWPFGKKKKDPQKEDAAPAQTEAETTDDLEVTAPKSQDTGIAADTDPSQTPSATGTLADYDPISGSTGPFDGDNVDIEEFDFSDFSQVNLNLGSMQIPLPKDSQVQVEMGENGPKMVHIVTRYGRITPVAFAAPRNGGLWAESAEEIAEGMKNEDMPVEFEEGPWGTEIVGTGANGVIRIIGVEAPRWLYRVTLAAPAGMEEQLAELGREVVARSFVYRGPDPILAGNSLPVVLPAQLARQVQQAVQERAAQESQQQSPQAGNPNALSDALKQIIAQNNEANKNN